MPTTNPKFSSYASSVPRIYNTQNSSAQWVPDPNIWRRSGSSYFGRFDDINEVDNTNVPISGVDLIFGGTGFQVIANSTVYVGTLVDAALDAVALPLPACTIGPFYVASSTAPGTGETYTFTVFKNSVVQVMQAVISGSGVSSSYSSTTIAYSAGDKFSVRIQTSSGAATAYLTYSCKIE